MAFRLSRSQSCGLIESGQVYINSRLNTSNGAVLKDGDMISVRDVYKRQPVEYPVCWLEIQPAYPKYAEKLGHRDFLGSILGLGLERSCIGDLLIENSTARILCLERVQDFIIQELTQVRHTSVQAKVIEIPESVARPKFETIHGTVNSLRLDAVISLAFRLSRSQDVYKRQVQTFI